MRHVLYGSVPISYVVSWGGGGDNSGNIPLYCIFHNNLWQNEHNTFKFFKGLVVQENKLCRLGVVGKLIITGNKSGLTHDQSCDGEAYALTREQILND